MYTTTGGQTTTSDDDSGGLHSQGMRAESISASAPRGLELVEVQQRAQLLEYAQRSQHYLHASLLSSSVGRVMPSTSTALAYPTAAAALGYSGLLSFIYSKLHDGTSSTTSSYQHLRFLQAAAAASAAATTPASQHEEPKPSQSYIGLIAMAILSSKERKLVLSDIYQWILDHYAYFRYRGPGWRNSIRHNLSLNDCFVKAGRSANGKGHYWAIHPANVDDFQRGDFRRRRAQRKVRRAMGLSVPDDDDSPGPSPSAGGVPLSPSYVCNWTPSKSSPFFFGQHNRAVEDDWARSAPATHQTPPRHHQFSVCRMSEAEHKSVTGSGAQQSEPNITDRLTRQHHHPPAARRRLFNMDSILAPDDDQLITRTETRISAMSAHVSANLPAHQSNVKRFPYTFLDNNEDT